VSAAFGADALAQVDLTQEERPAARRLVVQLDSSGEVAPGNSGTITTQKKGEFCGPSYTLNCAYPDRSATAADPGAIQRDKDRLAAEQSLAEAARWATIWTIVLASAAILAVFVSAGAVYYMRKTLNLTRELAVAERRPWIGEDIQLQPDNVIASAETGQWHVMLTVWAKNSGQAPARNVRVARLGEIGERERDSLLAAITSRGKRSGDGGVTIFPNSTAPLTTTVLFENRQSSSEWQVLDGYFGGWIEYEFAGSDARHITPFAYQINYRSNAAAGHGQVHLAPLHHNLVAT
jgi:hypothetical protein